MTHQVFPEDPELTDTEPPRQYVKRKKTAQDWVQLLGGITALIATLGGAASYAANIFPWVRTDVYDRDTAENDVRFQKIDAANQSRDAVVAAIQRNGLLTLQLQYQQRMDALAATLKTMQPNNPNYYQLSVAHDEAQQQIDEIKRQLRR